MEIAELIGIPAEISLPLKLDYGESGLFAIRVTQCNCLQE
jgi:hypothetical protein